MRLTIREYLTDLRDILFDLFDERFPGREGVNIADFFKENHFEVFSIKVIVKIKQVRLNDMFVAVKRITGADKNGTWVPFLTGGRWQVAGDRFLTPDS